METWATVALVLGSNAIMGVVNWLTTRTQIKNSDNQLEKRLQAHREEYQHRQRWDSRSQPLLELRTELARMTQKLEDLVNWAVKAIEGIDPNQDKVIKILEGASKDFNAYLTSGKFYQAVHMQYDNGLKNEAHRIFLDYQSAYQGVIAFWQGGDASEKIREASELLERNGEKVTAVQSKINELLEQL